MGNQYTVLPANLECYKGYTPPSLKSTVIYAECIPPDYCEELCKRIDGGTVWESTVHDPTTGTKVDNYHRSSVGITIDEATYQWIANRINEVVQYHVRRQTTEPFRSLRIAEPVQFLRYDWKRQSRFRRHWDDAYHDANGVFHFTAPWRKFTTITFLDNEFEGGELVLDTVKDEMGRSLVISKPVKGSILIFPSDQRFPHEVMPVTKGVRHSIVTWFDLER